MSRWHRILVWPTEESEGLGAKISEEVEGVLTEQEGKDFFVTNLPLVYRRVDVSEQAAHILCLPSRDDREVKKWQKDMDRFFSDKPKATAKVLPFQSEWHTFPFFIGSANPFPLCAITVSDWNREKVDLVRRFLEEARVHASDEVRVLVVPFSITVTRV